MTLSSMTIKKQNPFIFYLNLSKKQNIILNFYKLAH